MALENIVPNAALTGSTIDKYIRKLADPILDRHPVTGLLKAKGRIEYNCSGTQMTWPVVMRRPTPTAYLPDEPRSAPRRAYHKTATLPWRMFGIAERVDEFTKRANRGAEALAKHWTTAISKMTDSMGIKLGQDFLAMDGNASGYTTEIHGMKSFLTQGLQVGTLPSFAPNDTYAGLSTVVGTYGGTAALFPEHTSASPVTVEACFWSPILIDVKDDYFTGTSHTWFYQWRQAMEYSSMWMMERQGIRPDTWLTTPSWFHDIKQSLAASEQINVNRGDNSLATKLGYESVSLNGIDITYTQDMPASTCYGIKWDKVGVHSLGGQLFETDKERDWFVQSDVLGLTFMGNLRFESPAYFIKLGEFS